MYEKYPTLAITHTVTDIKLDEEMGLALHLPKDNHVQVQLSAGGNMILFAEDPTAIQIEKWNGHRPFVQRMKEIENAEYEEREKEINANANRLYKVEFFSGMFFNSSSEKFGEVEIFWRGPKNEMEMTQKAILQIDGYPRSYNSRITFIGE